MTLQEQAKYGPCPEGWHRFDFKLYKKVVIAKSIRNIKNGLSEIEQEPNYQRPQQTTIN